MFLNPADPVWPGLVKAALVLALVVASGAPLAWTVFGSRSRHVWLGYTPVMGVGLHLLTANLCAWVAPGVVGSWLGLSVALVTSSLVAAGCRPRMRCPTLSRSTWAWIAAGTLLTAGLLYMALANRTHVLFTDEPWHLPLAATMAGGIFPPVSPFSPAFGAAYHYGSDLLAASLMNVAGIAPWTAFFLVTPLLAVIFPLTAATAALDFGASRLAALSVGLITSFLVRSKVTVGLPTAFGERTTSENVGDVLLGFGVPPEAALFQRMGPALLNLPHFALGMTLLVIMAAALHAGHRYRHATVFACGLALLPLAETAAFIVGAAGTVLYFATAVWRWKQSEQRVFVLAAVGGLSLATLGGGAITDVLFRNSGGAGTGLGLLRDASVLVPGVLSPDGGFNAHVGPLPFVLGVTLAAVVARRPGLGFLAATTVGGLVARQVLNFEVTGVDDRLLNIPYTLAALGSVIALGARAARLRSAMVGTVAGVALLALVALPTAAPRLIGGIDFAGQGIYLGYPVVQHSQVRYANQTRFAAALRDEWRVLDWMRRELPDNARILAENAALVSMATGRVTPQSGHSLALFNPMLTPLYLDALRFLAQVDLEELGVTHLYVTPDLLDELDATARAALEDPKQFQLLTRQYSTSDQPLLVYAIQTGAGRETTDSGSFRRLAELGRQVPARAVSSLLSAPQRQTVLLNFAPEFPIYGPDTYLPRTNIRAVYETPVSSVQADLLILNDAHVPVAWGKYRDDAIWHGHGLRAYTGPADAWSRTWRPGPELQFPPADIMERYRDSDTDCHVRIIGEPGDTVRIGRLELQLTGVPQTAPIASTRCDALLVAWSGNGVNPFIQIRPGQPEAKVYMPPAAGLAFDGSVIDDVAVFHVWYRNPDELRMSGGVAFRLYSTGRDGLLSSSTPAQSVAWWLGPIELSRGRFTDRFEFNAASIELNDERLLVNNGQLSDGTYVLTLNVDEQIDEFRDRRLQHIIPIVIVNIVDGKPSYRPLSGIVSVR